VRGVAGNDQDRFRCQCARFTDVNGDPRPCTARMTQEDLLCDICRGGRCSMLSIGRAGSNDMTDWETQHVLMGPIKFTPNSGPGAGA
jgi:hypothetical protein